MATGRGRPGAGEETAPLTLAFDLGSTNLKAALFDAKLNRLAEASVPLSYTVFELPRVEFDPSAVLQATVAAARDVCNHAGIESRVVSRLALTSQAQTFALFDTAGMPLTPFISWMDERATAEAADLDAAFGTAFHAHCSFSPPLAQLQLAKLLWFRRRKPAVLDRTARILQLPTWLATQLAGLEIIDRNIAAMSGLYSLRHRGWWADVLDLCGVRPDQLSPLVDAGTTHRAVPPADGHAPPLGFSPDLILALAGNDQTAGAIGNSCGAGTLVVTLGTAAVAYRLAGMEPGPYAARSCWGPYPGGGYYEMGVASYGTVALDWARARLFPGGDLGAFFLRAQVAWLRVASGGIPHVLFFPERMATPAAWEGPDDPDRRALAVLEGIAFVVRRLILDDLQAGSAIEAVTVVGGGSSSDLWLQILADVLNCRVRRGTGDALLGAAMAASPGVVPPDDSGIASGAYGPDSGKGAPLFGQARGARSTFEPDAVRVRAYQALYTAWERR